MLAPRVLVAMLLLSAAPAHAEQRTSITIQPLYLILPMVATTIEVQPTPRIGIAGTAGVGHLFSPAVSNALYELGGQGNVYLLRDFSGWHVGAELFYMWGQMSGTLLSDASSQMEISSAGRIVGLYGGYKWLTHSGFTAVVEYGVGRIDAHSTTDAPISKVIPIANLALGWSF